MEKKMMQFLETLRNDPKAKEIMKGMKKPENDGEIIENYLAIAEKTGFDLTREDIQEGVSSLMKEQQARTANTAEQVQKTAISDEALDNVAGGWDPNCDQTYSPGEWCWFTDSCEYLITFYNDTKKISFEDKETEHVDCSGDWQ